MSFRDLTQLRRYYAGQAGTLVTEFYVPVLREAISYDRQAGFFDSASLVQIASGLAAFIHRVKDEPGFPATPMRLVTGATWSAEDIDAYQRGSDALAESIGTSLLRHLQPTDDECRGLGLPPGWLPEEDQIARDRLGALAWLVASGLLEVRIALPVDADGKPYEPGRMGALFHPKSGILRDVEGNTISFQGSVNETGAAWARNREKFEVKRSWFAGLDEQDIAYEAKEFERIWNGTEPGLKVLPLPEAVRQHLLKFVPPDGPPVRDPLSPVPVVFSLMDRIEAQWILDAPRLPAGERLILDPLLTRPYPHQRTVVEKTVSGFPKSFMFCDEVGLGKTIEAGLSLRWLLLRGIVQRVLIAVPRSLVRQWMEELREKFALTAWFYDGDVLRDVDGHVRDVPGPLEEPGVTIVSRQLLSRSDRREEVLSVPRGWDVVVVDEAHAARRKVFGGGPNQLLSLLQHLSSHGAFRALWLLTATPMQLNVQEVHDLLLLCGLRDPSWREWQDFSTFERFFDQLRSFPRDRSVRSDVLGMARTAVSHGAPELDETTPPRGWSDIAWRGLVARVKSRAAGLTLALREMPYMQAESLGPYLARETPLGVHMFRYTRATLRAYQERGLVQRLPTRSPEDVPVDFGTDMERQLYTRIDKLCSRFYRMAELPPDERAGLGFTVAVFRKRLSSSLEALRKSLENRRNLVISMLTDGSGTQGLGPDDEFLDPDDDDEEPDARQALDAERRRLGRLARDPYRRGQLEEERRYLQDYITQLGQVAVDSKFQAFSRKLEELISKNQRVIVFTQYLDTLDFVRDRLIARYGNKLACYSGRGGEVWDPALNRWVDVGKAEIKARADRSHPQAITILLGTDAASEGLNLQQFSAMVNYDLPWNPMRVEQRIGRIDRIGQESETAKIVNLYMRGTIEEDAYNTLKTRIGLFEDVVGPLQPILSEMPRVLRRLARGEIELAEARRLLEQASKAASESPIALLDDFVQRDLPRAIETVSHHANQFGQHELLDWCLAHPAPGMLITEVAEPEVGGRPPQNPGRCFSITWALAPAELGVGPGEAVLVTFDSEVADRHPPTAPADTEDGSRSQRKGVRLLTWGDPYVAGWLAAVRGEPLTEGDYRTAGLEPGICPFPSEA